MKRFLKDRTVVLLTILLIFAAILAFRLYRTVRSPLLLIKATAQVVYETVTLVQEGLKPLLSILSLIQDIRGGFEGISKMFNRESNKGGNQNE